MGLRHRYPENYYKKCACLFFVGGSRRYISEHPGWHLGKSISSFVCDISTHPITTHSAQTRIGYAYNIFFRGWLHGFHIRSNIDESVHTAAKSAHRRGAVILLTFGSRYSGQNVCDHHNLKAQNSRPHFKLTPKTMYNPC